MPQPPRQSHRSLVAPQLKFTPSKTSHSVQVAAPYFATENKKLGDVSYLETVGYHYCKLLSPARAMEWIYIDALADPLEP